MSLLNRVMQIVFEVASCHRQDILSQDEKFPEQKLPPHLSLKTSTSELFPDQQSPEHESVNACVVLIRSMLLRAQYGGMKCDVQMLHMFAIRWLKRFQLVTVPESFDCLTPENTPEHIQWVKLPTHLHKKASEKSKELITPALVCPRGLLKLSTSDVCSAGIDFHCSSVVEYLLSQPAVYDSLCERLGQATKGNKMMGSDLISGKLNSFIWNYSSGINHRCLLFSTREKKDDDSMSKAIWDDIIKIPFNNYTKKFVRDRLA